MAKRVKHSTPVVSKAQFKAMAAARSAQEGKSDSSKLYGAAREMYESMETKGEKSPKSHMEEVAGKRYKKLPSKLAKAIVRKSRKNR